MENQEYLFVYGTLLKTMQHAMHLPITHHAELLESASFQGKLYEVNGYPGAIFSPNPHEQVMGEIYLLHQADKLFPLLDEYEECNHDFPAPTEYIRQKTPVLSASGRGFLAWIYLYNWKVRGLQRIYSGDYRRFSRKKMLSMASDLNEFSNGRVR
ncbi:gamma-glutamylcyclotransferase family protein [Beggiatoa leptomitoformis]|uniref:Gamma-glutamylcyclotransferase n=1 Tax=Beggiatoa leptomitoformis TaxID=288004 RepID=A0A2N9YEU7_9GAMM|nr:gamma-glutamylcyclotransferase family protein [Beggiatoa leptomitoformis]AUI69007.1 gamma-glutamylcyclotransferase [Beggiatoa leptomitoformis]QGX03767.1 gamma-glutamylcyclotransferase [Beggiatoa leptomitoformis]